MVDTYKPWAVINTAGYLKIEEAEKEAENCFLINSVAPKYLSMVCRRKGIQFLTFSSDLVFDGKKNNPYLESDSVSPLSVFGQSKAMAEESVLHNNPNALIIRTSAFFGPWDKRNFVYNAIKALQNQEAFSAPNDVIISPTYVPDLVHTSLDLLIDEASGVCNISNRGSISWAMLVSEIAERSGCDVRNFKALSLSEMNFSAARPAYSVLETEKGYELPTLDHALGMFFREQECIAI
jgi:dTDP-4-dehydrorhamnose reductase